MSAERCHAAGDVMIGVLSGRAFERFPVVCNREIGHPGSHAVIAFWDDQNSTAVSVNSSELFEMYPPRPVAAEAVK